MKINKFFFYCKSNNKFLIVNGYQKFKGSIKRKESKPYNDLSKYGKNHN